jgi:hypothetical protein
MIGVYNLQQRRMHIAHSKVRSRPTRGACHVAGGGAIAQCMQDATRTAVPLPHPEPQAVSGVVT